MLGASRSIILGWATRQACVKWRPRRVPNYKRRIQLSVARHQLGVCLGGGVEWTKATQQWGQCTLAEGRTRSIRSRKAHLVPKNKLRKEETPNAYRLV